MYSITLQGDICHKNRKIRKEKLYLITSYVIINIIKCYTVRLGVYYEKL